MIKSDAAGATVQIFMFAVLACKVKQNAPRCHTFLEIIHRRYGPGPHMVFIFFALLTNILVASQLLLGGSAVVTALTGMNVYAAIFLIPLGVCLCRVGWFESYISLLVYPHLTQERPETNGLQVITLTLLL
jgi:hypothetical protein